MVKAKLFRNNKSQAVRLPKDVAFPESVTEVEITRVGDRCVISPVGKSFDLFFDGPGMPPDFMIDRDQPADQARPILEQWVKADPASPEAEVKHTPKPANTPHKNRTKPGSAEGPAKNRM
ncbi:MAG: type II toxin-antitoxin system VapB family antitoxin [Parvularculaceae bacterium]